MRTEWGRAKSTGGPSIRPVYTYALVLISLMATIGIQGFRCERVWTPLERHYLPAYLGSQMAGVVRDNGSYTLLHVVTRKGTRVALDSDVVPEMSESGQNVFALTEEAVKHGGLRLEFHRAYYNNAELHAYLGNLIYHDQSPMDHIRPALWAGLVLFFAGLFPATYLDRNRASALRNGRKPRGPELMSVAQSNRPQSSRGRDLVNTLRTILTRVMGSEKKLHLPLAKDNPCVLTMKAALPEEPPKIATVAAGTDNAPQRDGKPQEPMPIEQTPSQDPEFEHAVKPPERRFFE